jgi:pyruvyl transferase EpsO
MTVFNHHRDLTILVRDFPSLELLQSEFVGQTFICPDAAFCLGAMSLPRKPDLPVLYLARQDKEARSNDSSVALATFPRYDWPSVERAWKWHAGLRMATIPVNHPRVAKTLHATAILTRRGFRAMVQERLLAGCNLLARGEVIITDRLHAHILALLLGISHIVMDNTYGKIARFREAWTASSHLSVAVTTGDEALEAARAMLRHEG